MENNIQTAIEKAKQYKDSQYKATMLHLCFTLAVLLIILAWLLFDIYFNIYIVPRDMETKTVTFVEQGLYTIGEPELKLKSTNYIIPNCGYLEEGKVVYCETPISEQPKHSATFKVTYYCGCSKCCGKWSSGSESEATGAAGTKLKPFYSVAVDRKVIPLGTILTDENGNEYKAEDTGGAIKGNRIDIFTGNHQEALNQGVKEITFYWN